MRLAAGDALFLDVDGTLIDIAPTPDGVVVPAGLAEALRVVERRLGGALAILSGRRLTDIDGLLGAGLVCAAEHGGVVRGVDGVVRRMVRRPAAFESWVRIFARYAAAMPGVLVEEKEFSVVLHYRRAPEHEAALRQLVEKLVAESDDAVLLLAHCAFELKPRGGNKGDALAGFMAGPPFAGRRPVFVGDDVTDEPAIAKAIELGGLGLHVARDFGGATAAVRGWITGS
jgi:trehalose 6-phosphate phosphatase